MAITAAGFSFHQNGISDEMIMAEAKTDADSGYEDWEVGILSHLIFSIQS